MLWLNGVVPLHGEEVVHSLHINNCSGLCSVQVFAKKNDFVSPLLELICGVDSAEVRQNDYSIV